MMDLDELQSVQSRERQTDSLQQLRESFYRDAGEFIDHLRRERDRAAEQADDPWNAPEVSRLTDDIDTAEGTVEAIYERRVGKIVKMASLAAADMPTDDEGLTAEERDLFDTLVHAIEHNRLQVEAILDGDDPASVATDAAPADGATAPSDGAATVPDTAETEPPAADEVPPERVPDAASEPGESESGRVDAADLMGGDGGGSDPEPQSVGDEPVPPSKEPPDRTAGAGPAPEDPATAERDTSGTAPTDTDPGTSTDTTHDTSTDTAHDTSTDTTHDTSTDTTHDTSTDRAPEPPTRDAGAEEQGSGQDEDVQTLAEQPETQQVERETVRITNDVGEIFGVDERRYDLTADDVVTLPADNARPLVERDAAERLD